uniref:Uncharacterized protein n=1 Tax=Romanomermis culicivorax TaxID=13658 RepID=A0A915KDX8_ROMCU
MRTASTKIKVPERPIPAEQWIIGGPNSLESRTFYHSKELSQKGDKKPKRGEPKWHKNSTADISVLRKKK